MSARASRAPAPVSTANRAPASLTPRSKSRMPRAGPISQCGRGAKSNSGGAPCRRTSTLSASERPTGTLACGRFGSLSAHSRRSASHRLEPALVLLDGRRVLLPGLDQRLRRARRRACARAIRSPTSLRAWRADSSTGRMARRSASSATSRSSSPPSPSPRVARPARTSSSRLRSRVGSSMVSSPVKRALHSNAAGHFAAVC